MENLDEGQDAMSFKNSFKFEDAYISTPSIWTYILKSEGSCWTLLLW